MGGRLYGIVVIEDKGATTAMEATQKKDIKNEYTTWRRGANNKEKKADDNKGERTRRHHVQ